MGVSLVAPDQSLVRLPQQQVSPSGQVQANPATELGVLAGLADVGTVFQPELAPLAAGLSLAAALAALLQPPLSQPQIPGISPGSPLASNIGNNPSFIFTVNYLLWAESGGGFAPYLPNAGFNPQTFTGWINSDNNPLAPAQPSLFPYYLLPIPAEPIDAGRGYNLIANGNRQQIQASSISELLYQVQHSGLPQTSEAPIQGPISYNNFVSLNPAGGIEIGIPEFGLQVIPPISAGTTTVQSPDGYNHGFTFTWVPAGIASFFILPSPDTVPNPEFNPISQDPIIVVLGNPQVPPPAASLSGFCAGRDWDRSTTTRIPPAGSTPARTQR